MHCGPHLGSSILLLRTMNYSPLCYLVVIGLTCLLLLPAARAVTPIPDGAYPGQNVAEGGGGALGHLTTGLCLRVRTFMRGYLHQRFVQIPNLQPTPGPGQQGLVPGHGLPRGRQDAAA